MCSLLAGRAFALAATGAVLSASLSALGTAATDRSTHVWPLPPDRTIALHLTIGDIRIVGEPRRDALVEIVRQAPDSDALDRIPVSIDEQPSKIVIRAEQADGGTDPALRTDVTAWLPAGAAIDAVRIVEGRMTLEGLSGSVRADVRRGPIEARSVAGTVRLETEIGDITVRDARLVPGGLLRLRTFNGNVRLGLAERPRDARIMALALNGEIESEIPLTMKDTWGPRWGETTLGRGEPVISIDVVTGTIAISAP